MRQSAFCGMLETHSPLLEMSSLIFFLLPFLVHSGLLLLPHSGLLYIDHDVSVHLYVSQNKKSFQYYSWILPR